MSKSTEKTKKIKTIYLDHASATLPRFSNPGAIHELGIKERTKLEEARAKVAHILHARQSEVIFTSGATESNNLAILGLVQNFKMPHIITTNIEHSSVLEIYKHLERTKKAKVTFVPVEANGIVDIKKIKKALRPETVLVSVMYANNEIGTIEPISEISKAIRYFNKTHSKKKHKVFFHTDATQAVSYLPINTEKLGVDMMSFNNAKIYGEKGIGALYIKKGTPVGPIMFGGDQEFGLRPGTENVALAVKFARALEETEKIKEKETKRILQLRDYFLNSLLKKFPSISVNGDLKNRLPNNINVSFPKIPSDLLVIELSAKRIMASAKSACKSGEGGGSYVIHAIRPEQNGEIGGVRFSLGRSTTKKDIDYAVYSLIKIILKLEKWY